jgi:hypothetical protein
LRVFHRPLAIVSGLTIGDYLLWNWSLNGHHDVLALISGLTLPPLAIALLWLLALTLARVLASTTRRSRARPVGRARAALGERRQRGRNALDESLAAGALEQSPASSSAAPAASSAATAASSTAPSSTTASSGKLAA